MATSLQMGPEDFGPLTAAPLFASREEGAAPFSLPEDLAAFASRLRSSRDYGRAFVYQHHIPSRTAIYGPPLEMDARLQKLLHAQGLHGLYSHQTRAIQALRQGSHVLVATPTASGKTLIYNFTLAEALLRDPEARALYLFPLKALEQDQLKALGPWLNGLGEGSFSAEIYDGDTSAYRRKKIRERPPHILFTNPDMLHRGILAYHHQWERFLKHLRFVVLDEVHTYRGIFGSHVNQVLKRLKRLCALYGSSPRFILLSATISNPEEFGSTLIQEPIQVIGESGSPRSAQHFLFMNPEESANFLSAKLFLDCVRQGFRTIVFTQARKVTELIYLWVSRLAPALQKRISSYRAGFLPRERRDIERCLASGQLLGVVSTSALEMGIDIGHLDICLLVGYPGTIMNTFQRGGRVGRRDRESMVILVGKPDALDQYFMKHPEELFERSFEAAVLDPHNPYVLEAHLPCAAAERPIRLEDKSFWGEELEEGLHRLEQKGRLHCTAEGEPVWFASGRTPHLEVNLRASGETFTIFERDTGQAIGTVDGIRALKECHAGAIYLHRGRPFVIDRLILEKRDVVAQQTDHQYFTRTRSDKETEILQVRRTRPVAQFLVRQGDLKVTETITGYEKRALPGQELLGVFPLELPPQTFETTGFWLEIEDLIKRYVDQKGLHFMGGIHAIEHAAIGLFPLFALCDRNDIGGICYPHHPQVEKSAIFIYDGYPGGVGLAGRGYEVILPLLEKTWELLTTCECEEGCPSCIHSPKCGSGNKPLDKAAALVILEGLLGKIPLASMGETGTDQEPPLPPKPIQPTDVQEDPGPRILYLDLETRKSAQEVGGWQNAHLMRVSVAVLYDSQDDEFRVFLEDQMDDLIQDLFRADLIVGFNIQRFDYQVLSAYTGKDLKTLPTFDLLQDIYGRLGFRLGLDALAEATLNHPKTADGLQAIAWFREGRMEPLTAYCRNDVAVTRDLFLYGLKNGHLVYRKKDNPMKMRLLVDWDLEKLVGEGVRRREDERVRR